MKLALVKSQINDEIYTPECAIIPLLKYLPKDIRIWECTDYGGSNITKVLRETDITSYRRIKITSTF